MEKSQFLDNFPKFWEYSYNNVDLYEHQRLLNQNLSKRRKKVNKNDLIASVASSAGLSKSDATRAIESFLDAITNSLKRDEKVSIVGFGNFSVSHRKATTGRNPRTGESIQIPASKRPKFTVGKALKDSVNN